MGEPGLVTIALPTRDRADLLQATVRSALAQSYARIEVVIGDNASSDDTPRVVAAAVAQGRGRVRAVRHTSDLGMVGNWNSLLALARGELFLLLSDDDLLEPDAIAHLVEALRAPEVVLAYTRVWEIDAHGRELCVSAPGPHREGGTAFIEASLRLARQVYPSATLVRTARLRAMGGFPAIGTASDLAVRLRLAVEGDVAAVDRPLVRYRVHEVNESHNFEAVTASWVALATWGLGVPELRDRASGALQAWPRRSGQGLLRWAFLRGHAGAAAAAERMLGGPGDGSATPPWLRLLYRNRLARALWRTRRAASLVRWRAGRPLPG